VDPGGDRKGIFKSNLAHIREQGIQGVGDRVDRMCDFFEDASKGERFYYRVWPQSPFSVGFKSLIEKVLDDSFIVINPSASLCKFWDDTEALRRHVLDSMELDGLGGLRRGTVHNAILRWCSGKTTTVGGIEDILVEIGDEQVETIKRFLKWVTYCYQYNQDRMLDLRPGLLSVDEIDHEFVRRAAYLNEDLSGSMITETFRFPSAEAILTVDPDEILDMRNKGGGLEYFHAVERGQEKPSETSACLVLDALEKYTGDITKTFY
jgi:hypothetical protein